MRDKIIKYCNSTQDTVPRERFKVMCQAFGKQLINWLDLTCMDAIKARSENLTLVETRQGEENPFAEENKDWVGFTIRVNGNETKDFTLSLDFEDVLFLCS